MMNLFDLLGGNMRKKKGKKLFDCTPEERSEIDELGARGEALKKEIKRFKIASDEIKLMSNKWWNKIEQTRNTNTALAYEDGSVYELVDEDE